MKSVKVKFVGLILGLICVISVIALSIMFIQNNALASASTVNNTPSDEVGETVKYFRSDSRTIVEATFNYVRLNDSECSVKIANKAEATVAIIPKKGIIDGKEYTVTEIVSNGFASSPKLKRVCLSPNIKKINNSAFSNCAELEMVDLHKVETIGNNVFYICPKLQDIRIPETVTSVGSNVFRNDNIKVHVVGDKISVDESWSSSWNNYNNCTEGVDYETKYLDPIPLDEVYAENSRSTDQEPIGYAYAAGQPVNFSNKKIQTYSDGEIDKDNIDNYKDGDDNVIIPAICEEDGKPILRIAGDAFANTPFNRCVIEYYDEPIEIVSEAFYGADGNEVIINRDVTFESSESKEKYEEIFSYSYITSIVLPDSIVCLPDSVFAGCDNLTNIFFKTPDSNLSESKLLNLVDTLKNSENEGKVYLPQDTFNTIGESAFESVTTIKELHIYENVLTIRASAVSGWINGAQKVHVHNTKATPKYDSVAGIGWHENWYDKGFEVEYDKYIFIISLDPNEGTLDDDKKELEVELNKPIGDMPAPVREGYRFDGWYDDETLYNETDVYNDEKVKTLTAHWSKLFKVELRNLEKGTVYYTVEAVHLGTLPLFDENGKMLEIPEEDGYIFKGFWDTDARVKYYDENMKPNEWYNTDHIKLYAHWDKKPIQSYEIEYQVEGGPDNFNNPNPTSFNQDNVDNDNIKFQPILLTSQYPIKKIYWEYNSIKEAPSEKYLETGKLIVYGKVVEPKAHLTFELNGGTINTENTTLNFGDVFTDKPTKLAYKFEGWLVKNKNVEEFQYNDVGNSKIDEITLYAVWKARVSDKPIAINTQLTQFVVTGDCAIALNGSFMTYCRIIISADVKNVHIYSTATRVNKYHMYIVAENRTSNLNLYLENLEIVAPNDQVAISVPTARTTRIVGIGTVGLNLYTYGTVIIRGGNGSAGDSNNWDGRDGRVAIDCDRITIFCGDDLYILGGNGGKNYLTGKHGDGGYAVDANEVRICRTEVKGIRIYGGDGINYTKTPFPSKTTVTYFD